MALAGGDSWIGLRRAGFTSPWVWTDGSSYGVDDLGYSAKAYHGGGKELWEKSQGHDNVCARWGWGTAKVWDDVDCDDLNSFTCEKGGASNDPPFVYSPPPPISVNKIFIYHNERKNFADAERTCVQDGGHLASLHSLKDVNEVMDLARGDSWIGLQRSSVTSPWTWTDGSSYGIDDLGHSPTARGGGGKELWEKSQGWDNLCGRWGWGTAKVWDDVNCGDKNPFACEKGGSTNDPPYVYPPPPPSPPYDPTKKTFVFHHEHLSFADAERTCAKDGGHLASLHSRKDVNEVMDLARVDSWIGLQRSSVTSPWTWTDGSSYGIDDLGHSPTARGGGGKELWEKSQGSDGLCGRWGWGTAKVWDDVNCGDKNPFTCEKGGSTNDLPYVYSPPPMIYPPPPPSPPPRSEIRYCHVPDQYNENGRTNFGNDVCSDCTLAQCRARCDGIVPCIGFDTSIADETAKGTCWMKSYISIAQADLKSAHGGSRTTYYSGLLPAAKRLCDPNGSATPQAKPLPPPPPPPRLKIHYCHVPDQYNENGRTNFGNDVCSDCTLAQCRARCDGIVPCIGFDTSIADETAKGTCWMKSYISIAQADLKSAHGGSRTTYYSGRLPTSRRLCFALTAKQEEAQAAVAAAIGDDYKPEAEPDQGLSEEEKPPEGNEKSSEENETGSEEADGDDDGVASNALPPIPDALEVEGVLAPQ